MSTGFVHSHSASMRINAAPREAMLRNLQPPRRVTHAHADRAALELKTDLLGSDGSNRNDRWRRGRW
ncbi:hypothetical protein [Variovorax sp. YR750]|uniref:hypothetical protein n=1 Tax=Variovorax sp. YR750 TaxID=1884384 RepID=UPI002109BDDE|nr:hypothetical protein [Variovorax sp. YR750]MDP9606412.1 hypothetical protein [Variovorax paradoxus]